MSDNTTLPAGSGGDTIRTIDRTTSKTQVVALDLGGEVGPENLVNAATGLPVALLGTQDTAPLERVSNSLLMVHALLLAAQPTNGFTPLEIPAFLGGI
jgi:hypothetical protein